MTYSSAQLGPAQLDILKLIVGYTNTHDDCPTGSQLAANRGTTHQSVFLTLRTLRAKGLVKEDEIFPTSDGERICEEAGGPAAMDARRLQDDLQSILPELHLPCTVDQLYEALKADNEARYGRHPVLRAARLVGLEHTRSAQRCPGCSHRHYIVHKAPLTRDWLCSACQAEV